MTAAPCANCGAEPRVGARFCDACGSPISADGGRAEYKQVTVLFADVVRSMDIAAAVGAERLREIMTEVFNRSSTVVKRYGGTVDKFTGDGIMAVFGAPIALEDHALRACLAALDIQAEAQRFALELQYRDRVELQLRVGLNSGEVIAGEIGSGPLSYTAVGEQVGMAQRMESVAPPGGVMLSESTARLVEDIAVLAEPEKVRIKGNDAPVLARRLVSTASDGSRPERQLATLVGRDWEMGTIAGILDQAVAGKGRVVGLVGPPGIGKSRMVKEITSLAAERGADVYSTYCESHTSEIPFHVVRRLLRNVFGLQGVPDDVARAMVRTRLRHNDAEDLLLIDDMLGIRSPSASLPDIDPDARRRRLSKMLNTAAAARTTPAVFVIEDAHWIDDVSEGLLAEFGAVVPHTPTLVLVTYRPEYRGALDRLPSAHRIALGPLDNSGSQALAGELLGVDSSLAILAQQVAERAGGNPFFVEEIIRDLAERGVIQGKQGEYVSQRDATDAHVPASLVATISARIDRLEPAAKRTLNAAAVIGLRFDSELLASLTGEVELSELIAAELIDQIAFVPRTEYAFRHPLIRTVAYESQLKSDRSQLHRNLVAEIKRGQSLDTDAALIAEHLEAAGDLHEAYDWHMRAGRWAQFRDSAAAHRSWQRARDVADQLPIDDPRRVAMRIAPRSLICANSWRFQVTPDETGYDELRALCAAAGDEFSLVVGMSGVTITLLSHNKISEAARIAADCRNIVETGAVDRLLTAEAAAAAANTMFQAGQEVEALRLIQYAIDAGFGDSENRYRILGSPLGASVSLRGAIRFTLGQRGFREDLDQGLDMVASADDASSYTAALTYKHVWPVVNGVFEPDAAAERVTAEALERAERSGDNFALGLASLCRAVTLVHRGGDQRSAGLELLRQYGELVRSASSTKHVRFVDIEIAREKARLGDLDGAVDLARRHLDWVFESGDMGTLGPALTVLVEPLLHRGGAGDIAEAEAAIERLAAVPVDPGFVLHELPIRRLRALLARARGDDDGYRRFADSYREMANDVGFEGHMAVAATM
jgi:adenylate cyclase